MISFFDIFLCLVFLLALAMPFYFNKYIRKFKIFDKIENKYIRFIVAFIPFVPLFIFFNIVNVFVILFHLFIFCLITQLVLFLIKKYFNKELPKYLIILCSVIITTIYLGIGAYLDYHVFETKYEIETTKDIGTDRFRIIQISDSHVGATFDGKGFSKHIDKLSKIDADIFVITGDFIDDDTTKENMILACKALSKLKPKYGVFFVSGNHDRGYYTYRGYGYDELVNNLKENNVRVLEDQIVPLTDNIILIGRKDASYFNRIKAQDFTKSIEKEKYIIDLNHQPNDFENEKNAGIDLVLSGHTHGGQLFPLGYLGELTHQNDATYGLIKKGNTNFIVNSGISNWRVDFKTGTKSEYVIVDIINKKGE